MSDHVDSKNKRAGGLSRGRERPRGRCVRGKVLLAAALLLGWAGQSPAEDVSQHRSAGDLEIYWGVLPAEMVLGHEQNHDAGKSIRDAHHLVVALYSAATGERVVDAEVEARVEPLGLAGQTKPLETMTINGMVTFGNYFSMPASGLYRIMLRIRLDGAAWLETGFEYRHGGGR